MAGAERDPNIVAAPVMEWCGGIGEATRRGVARVRWRMLASKAVGAVSRRWSVAVAPLPQATRSARPTEFFSTAWPSRVGPGRMYDMGEKQWLVIASDGRRVRRATKVAGSQDGLGRLGWA